MSREFTDEEVREFEVRYEMQQKFLQESGWASKMQTYQASHMVNPCEIVMWVDPETGTEYLPWEAYDGLTMSVLKKEGWKAILQIKYIGDGKWLKREEWGRFQSPKTQRLYSFLEAQWVMENGWDEDKYPEGFSDHTVQLNRLVGENFSDDCVKTWFHNIGGKNSLELWNG